VAHGDLSGRHDSTCWPSVLGPHVWPNIMVCTFFQICLYVFVMRMSLVGTTKLVQV